jgi:hypothetical protein
MWESEGEEKKEGLLYPFLRLAVKRGGRVKKKEQSKGLLYPIFRLAGETGGILKMRSKKIIQFILSTEWLVRDVGE